MFMHQLSFSVFKLIVLFEELKQLLIQWCATNCLLRVVDFDVDIALFQYKCQHALIVHEDICHTSSIDMTRKMELSMSHITGVDTLKIIVFQYLQIQHSAIQVGYIR